MSGWLGLKQLIVSCSAVLCCTFDACASLRPSLFHQLPRSGRLPICPRTQPWHQPHPCRRSSSGAGGWQPHPQQGVWARILQAQAHPGASGSKWHMSHTCGGSGLLGGVAGAV